MFLWAVLCLNAVCTANDGDLHQDYTVFLFLLKGKI